MSRSHDFGWPRGLGRAEAARYVGVSPGTFDKLVSEGLMPPPKRVRTRLIFDKQAIDLAFSALGEEGESRNDFDGNA